MKFPKQPAPRFESAGCFGIDPILSHFSLPLNKAQLKTHLN